MYTVAFFSQFAGGKDTAANYMCGRLNDLGYGHWARKGFAHAVKKVFMDTFQVDWEFIEKWKRISEAPPGFKKNIRECLIFIGDGFRQMQSDIWIELAFRDQEHNQIISDGRYINEANYIRKKGGLNILMWRPGFENDLPSGSEQQVMPFVNDLCNRKPIPEGRLDKSEDMPFDLFIINDGTIKDLCCKMDELVIPEIIATAK
jgi:hypothetical protein